MTPETDAAVARMSTNDVPNAVDVEHVLGGHGRSVSSSDGWILLNNEYFHEIMCFMERCATETSGLRWRYRKAGEVFPTAIADDAKKLMGIST
jgi:hypothetical protein